MKKRSYIAIDLKSFYASVECVKRKRDPLTTNLVVADRSRTDKTICLAVSPSMKAYGIPGRARLFEVVQKVKEVNEARRCRSPKRMLEGVSDDANQLQMHPELAVDYIVAPPRMALYMEYSSWIYDIYLKYVAPEDIHVYSIDEVFMDVTDYLGTYRMSARKLVMTMIHDIFDTTGITATAGIGTNLYLCKVAMDIVAKHMEADAYGVRVAELDEISYRKLLWQHTPITDFWRVGKGYAKKLAEHGLYTMGDIARCSIGKPYEYYNEDLLYKLFGINAELLIDHAWGWEPCTIEDIKAYRPENQSIGSGQVLPYPYDFQKARLIVREMTDLLALKLVEQHLVADQIVMTVGYAIENIRDAKNPWKGETKIDHFGRRVPKHAHGTGNLECPTSSSRKMVEAATELYDRIVNPKLLIKRVSLAANHVLDEADVEKKTAFEQLDLFTDYAKLQEERRQEEEALEKEKRMQKAVLDIKKRFGKNAILKGMNLEEGATTMERNQQIGGHRA